MKFVFNKERLKQSIDLCVNTALSQYDEISVDDVSIVLFDIISGLSLIPASLNIANKLPSLVDYEK